MKIKKVILGVSIILLLLVISAIVLLTITNRRYTIEIRPMLGATSLDGESYIDFADLGDVTYYDVFLHYDDIDNFQSNYGALDIVQYYSEDCNYLENGTQINCEVVDINKKKLTLHYYGVGVNNAGEHINVNDTWEIDMTKLWNNEYAEPKLIS